MNLNVNKISRRVITIEPGQDITGIIDEIRDTKELQVYLYIPHGSRPFENALNLRLLKNESAALEKEVILVSNDAQIHKAAKKAELPVSLTLPPGVSSRLPSAGESQESDAPNPVLYGSKMFDIIPPGIKEDVSHVPSGVSYPETEEDVEEDQPEEEETKEETSFQEPVMDETAAPTGVGASLPPRAGEESQEVEEDEEKKDEEYHEGTLRKSGISFFWFFNILNTAGSSGLALAKNSMFFVGGLVFLVGIAGFVYFILPKAEVKLEPKKDLLTFDIAVYANTQTTRVDFSNNTIPGELLESSVELAENFISSGREVREEKARGNIIVYNEFSSSIQTLVENTRFISQDGKLFRSVKTVVVPGASIEEGKIVPSSIEIEVVGAEAGEDYNVGPSTFSIPGFKGTPKYTAFYGKSSGSIEGGFIGEVEVVTEEDIESANEIFRQALLEKVREDFRNKTPQDFILLDDAVEEEITELVSDKEAGDVAKSFTLSGKARVIGFVFDANDVSLLIEETIQGRMSPEKELLADTKKLVYKEVEIDVEAEEMTLLVGVEEWIATRVDESEIIEAIRGKSLEEVREYLASHPSLDSARVTFSPFWIKRVPRAADKIKIEVVKTIDEK